jgi:hypothetical protein
MNNTQQNELLAILQRSGPMPAAKSVVETDLQD